MPLIRGHHFFDDHFTQIPNDWVRDTRLSLKAIGLLVQLMSHAPGWKMSIRSLARANGTGIDTIKSAVNELESLGYLRRSEEQKRGEDGTFADYDWTTADPFQNPVTGKTRHGETAHKEEQIIKEEKVIKNTQERDRGDNFEQFWKAYPRGEGKAQANKAYLKALKKISHEELMKALEVYKTYNNRHGIIFAHASSWLNGERWQDEYEATYSAEVREKSIDQSKAYLAELEEMAKKAAPPPKCEHGNTLARCPICLAS